MTPLFWWGVCLVAPIALVLLACAADWAWHNPKELGDALIGIGICVGIAAAVIGLVFIVVGAIDSSRPWCGSEHAEAMAKEHGAENIWCRVS